MTKSYHGEVVAAILEVLKREGKLVYSGIAKQCRLNSESIRKTCARMASEPRNTRRIHVCEWITVVEGQRDYLRPVYKLGCGQNRRRPPAKPRATIVSDYYRRKQAECGSNAFGPLVSNRKKAAKIIAARNRGET